MGSDGGALVVVGWSSAVLSVRVRVSVARYSS